LVVGNVYYVSSSQNKTANGMSVLVQRECLFCG
jgi:hypothetical protein